MTIKQCRFIANTETRVTKSITKHDSNINCIWWVFFLIIIGYFKKYIFLIQKNYFFQIKQARTNPLPIYDLSECNLDNVPSSTYLLCEVFRKETLLLHCNKLKSLLGGGALKNLSLITILDLHSNELNDLPSDVVHLVSLKVTNYNLNKNLTKKKIFILLIFIRNFIYKIITCPNCQMKSLVWKILLFWMYRETNWNNYQMILESSSLSFFWM